MPYDGVLTYDGRYTVNNSDPTLTIIHHIDYSAIDMPKRVKELAPNGVIEKLFKRQEIKSIVEQLKSRK